MLRELLAPIEDLEARARALAERLGRVAGDGASVAVERDRGFVGGGSTPELALDSWVVTLRTSLGASALADRLREAPVPVIARLRADALAIDVRTLLDGDEDDVERALEAALREPTR